MEIECFDSGIIEQQLVPPGTRVPVGAVLATIAAGPEPPSPATAPLAPAPPAAPPAGAPVPSALVTSPLVRRLAADRHIDLTAVRGTGLGGRITHADLAHALTGPPPAAPPGQPATVTRAKVSPMARRLAAELGVDLAQVVGTGPGGAIGADDVRHDAMAPRTPAAPSPASSAAEHTAALRATIAALMARSKREIPHYYLTETIDLHRATVWLRERNRALPVPQRLVPAALLLKAAALAAHAVPDLNGFWLDGTFVAAGQVHLGVAVALRGGGLVAPAIHDATTLSLDELMAHLKDLVVRTRAGRLRRAELADPTITVSNLGEQGVESILGVIYPPQVALVGFGKIVDRPWAVDGLIGVRPTVTASLAADHRATDGATGARFLQAVAKLLQHPEEL